MIIDPREGSGDLADPLRLFGVPVEVAAMSFGDVSFIGNGPGGRPVLVGIEVKKLGDLLQCIRDDRYVGHQLQGLRESYEVRHLLVEGIVSAGPRRELVTWKSGHWKRPYEESTWTYEAYKHWLFTQLYRSGIHVDETADRRATVAWLAECYSWWTEKKFEEHRSHEGLYFRPMLADDMNPMDPPSELTQRRMLGLQGITTGVGYDRARAAAEKFRSVEEMYFATTEEWKKVPGFGNKLAARAWEAFRVREV